MLKLSFYIIEVFCDFVRVYYCRCDLCERQLANLTEIEDYLNPPEVKSPGSRILKSGSVQTFLQINKVAIQALVAVNDLKDLFTFKS